MVAIIRLLPILAVLLLPRAASAISIVIPGAYASTEGEFENEFPFGIAGNCFGCPESSQRYQQVYSSADFLGFGPVLITRFAFRPDGDQGEAFDATLPNVQISFSTTSKTWDGLSAVFADNIGTDEQVVFDGPLTLSSADTGSGPRAFDISIDLANPFLYDPSLGNLLLDVRNFDGRPTTYFDAVWGGNQETSRVVTWSGDDGTLDLDVTSPAGLVDKNALVTQFTFTPVPEPGTFSLVGVALFCLGLSRLGSFKEFARVMP